MSVIIDVAVIAVSCVTVYFCYRGGFMRMFVRILGYLLAFIIASSVSLPIAKAVFESYVRPQAEKSVSDIVEKNIGGSLKKGVGSVSDAVDDVYNGMPEFMSSYLNSSGFEKEKITDSLSGFSSGSYAELSSGIVDALVKPIVVNLLEAIVFLLALLICSAAVRILMRALRSVKRVPVIGPLNSLLGGVLGILQAALIIYILAAAVKIFILCTGNANGIINESVVENTYIFNIFYKYNLFS